MTLCF